MKRLRLTRVSTAMSWSTNLMIDNGRGEQVVRRPRASDAVGSALRDSFRVGGGLPEDMLAVLRRLDAHRKP